MFFRFETSKGYKRGNPNQSFSPYRTGLYSFSHLFVLIVFDVGHGHPAEAELFAGLDETIVGGTNSVDGTGYPKV